MLAMDFEDLLMRGWREALACDTAVVTEAIQVFCLIIADCLSTVESAAGIRTSRSIGRAFSPRRHWGFGFLGDCPKLIWAAPLALSEEWLDGRANHDSAALVLLPRVASEYVVQW